MRGNSSNQAASNEWDIGASYKLLWRHATDKDTQRLGLEACRSSPARYSTYRAWKTVSH